MTKLEEIKSKVDIVEVIGNEIEITKKGQNYWALCPFHKDTNPSMSISPTKQIYKCFTCNAAGDAIKFISDFKKITFQEAIKILADKVGIDYYYEKNEKKYDKVEEELILVMKDATLYMQNEILSSENKSALNYLYNRGIDKDVIDRFQIGFQPANDTLEKILEKKDYKKSTLINASIVRGDKPFFANRVVFPIKNYQGDIVAFSGRIFDKTNNSKYVNSIESRVFDKSNILYNYFDAKNDILRSKEVYITEGFMDVIALHRANINNAIALMGTALTPHHIKHLKGLKNILMLDGDNAGLKATLISIELLLKNNIKAFVIKMPKGKDVDELLSEGEEILKTKVNDQMSAIEFIFYLFNKKYPEISPDSNEKYLKEISKFMKYSTEIEKDFFIKKISSSRGISEEILFSKFENKDFDKTTEITHELQENFSVPIKTITKNIFIKRNYEYDLINSMINHPKLIRIYEKNNVIHSDAIILQIAKYLVSIVNKKENIEAPFELKEKIKEVKISSNIISDDVEFEELMKRVTKQSLKKRIAQNKVKLRQTKNEKEMIELVELNKELNKKIKEL